MLSPVYAHLMAAKQSTDEPAAQYAAPRGAFGDCQGGSLGLAARLDMSIQASPIKAQGILDATGGPWVGASNALPRSTCEIQTIGTAF